MSDPLAPELSGPASRAGPEEERTLPIVIYVLYLLGFVTGFLTTLVGLVMAYVLRGEAGPVGRSHYTFLIRTFWIALIASACAGVLLAVGVVLSVILIGVPIVILAGLALTVVTIWFAVRCLVGLVRVSENRAYPTPESWIV